MFHGNIQLHVITSYSIHYTRLYDILVGLFRKRPLTVLRRLGLLLVSIDFAIVVTDALVFSFSLVGIIFSFLSMVAFVVIGGIFTGRTLRNNFV